jgi:transcriptional regulator with XRE-family HTH domain
MTHFGRLIASTRERSGLSRQQLAEQLGYANANKGARRIEALEAGCGDDAGIVEKVIEALRITEAAAAEAVRLDDAERRQKYLEAIAEPIAPVLTIRVMPAIYANHPLPEGMNDPLELESYACGFARENRLYVHLTLASRTSLWINPQGEVYERSEPDDQGLPVGPSSRIGGKPLPGFLTDGLVGGGSADE